VAVTADESTEGLRREITKQALERRGHVVISSMLSMMGRMST
jgi:hypothetical protein